MASCSIRWCGKSSRKSNYETDGITFHRFPREASIKEKWIACTKRENWFPSNYSIVCSRHFTEDCFYTLTNRRRLFDSAIPTMHLPVVNNTAVTSDCAPYDLNTIPSSSSLNEQTSTALKATKRKATDPKTPSQIHSLIKKPLLLSLSKTKPITITPIATKRLQCHSPTRKRLYRRVVELSNKVKQKNKTIREFRDKARYYKKRVASLQFIIKEYEEKSPIKAENADI